MHRRGALKDPFFSDLVFLYIVFVSMYSLIGQLRNRRVSAGTTTLCNVASYTATFPSKAS